MGFDMQVLIRELKKNRTLFIMLLPAIIYFLVFSYTPMLGSIVAFKEYNFQKGIFGSPWAGFTNFRFFFISGQASRVTRNTFLYNLLFMTTANLLQITVALFMSEIMNVKFKKIAQSLLFLPHFISWVVVGAFMYNIFNYDFGLLNGFLSFIGANPVDVYQRPDLWPIILCISNLWKGVGYGSILYLAAIMGLPAEIYEAATIDGASIFQRIRRITLPLLMPTLATLLLLSVGAIFRSIFDMFYQTVGEIGQLYSTTDVIDTFVFRSLLRSYDFGMSSAAAFFQSILCFATIMSVNGIVRKIDYDYALF
jgi:putative aldouronate transport system permease protein